MQMLGARVNIVGLLWQIVLTVQLYTIMRPRFPSRGKAVIIESGVCFIVAAFVVKAVHQMLDSVFMLLEVLSGNAGMISANDPAWNWGVYWFFYVFTLVFCVLVLKEVFKLYRMKSFIRWGLATSFAFVLVVLMWCYHLAYFPYDYAVLVGELRLKVFWAVYVPLYFSYGLFYCALWNRDELEKRI